MRKINFDEGTNGVGSLVVHMICLLLPFVLFVLIVAAVSGCTSTKYVEVPSVHTEYVTRTDSFLRSDTLIVKDSVVVKEKGDTLTTIIWKWRDKIVTEYKNYTDTIWRTDSVSVPYPVERDLTAWEKVYLGIGRVVIALLTIALVVVVIYAVWWMIKARKK